MLERQTDKGINTDTVTDTEVDIDKLQDYQALHWVKQKNYMWLFQFDSHINSFFLKKKNYLFMRDVQREAETQAEEEAGSMWEA